MKSRLIALTVALLLGVTGTVVLVRYVKGADARALAGTRTVDVLMVQENIPAGTPAEALAGMVAVTAVPALAAVPDRITDLGALDGQSSVVELVPGEQLSPHHFALPADTAGGQPMVPDGYQQFTIQLQSQRALGGAIAAGDRVGMFLSFTPDVAPTYMTHLRLSSVLVTAVRSAAGDTPSEKPDPADGDAAAVAAGSAPANPPAAEAGVELYVTFATTAADAEVAIFAAEFGTIWLSDEPLGSDETGTRIVAPPDVYGTAPPGGTP